MTVSSGATFAMSYSPVRRTGGRGAREDEAKSIFITRKGGQLSRPALITLLHHLRFLGGSSEKVTKKRKMPFRVHHCAAINQRAGGLSDARRHGCSTQGGEMVRPLTKHKRNGDRYTRPVN